MDARRYMKVRRHMKVLPGHICPHVTKNDPGLRGWGRKTLKPKTPTTGHAFRLRRLLATALGLRPRITFSHVDGLGARQPAAMCGHDAQTTSFS